MGTQSFGEKFDLQKLLRARDVARDMTYELYSLLRPGMTEEDAVVLYKELSKKYGVEKQWHPPKMRFGPNTVCNFRDESRPHVLKDEDIVFIDIGPVIDGHEADYGETFALGNQYEYKLIADSSKKVFNDVVEHWRKTKASGPELYRFADSRAKAYGHVFNDAQDGHRIGDFPHHIHYKGGLAECSENIVPNAWILEIHLWDPQKRFGAFFEDILTDEVLS